MAVKGKNKRGRPPSAKTEEERIRLKKQREHARYLKRKARGVFERPPCEGVEKNAEGKREQERAFSLRKKAFAENSAKIAKEKSRGQGRIRAEPNRTVKMLHDTRSLNALLESEEGNLVSDRARRAAYNKLLCKALVRADDYCDKDGRALELHELPRHALEAAQIVRVGGKIIAMPPSERSQLDALKALGAALSIADIAKMTADRMQRPVVINVVGAKMTKNEKIIENDEKK